MKFKYSCTIEFECAFEEDIPEAVLEKMKSKVDDEIEYEIRKAITDYIVDDDPSEVKVTRNYLEFVENTKENTTEE